MPKETVGLKIDIDSRSVATAARRSDDLARSSGKVGDALGGMARAAAAVGVAATAAVAGVVALTLRIAEQSDEIAKHSSRLGISIESYQELSHAMELSGGSIGEASAAIRRLSGNMLDASQGVSTAVDAFADLGIETTTAAGGMRSVDAVLADIADEFEAMPDGVEKTARAMELFGRSGAALIPLLNQGSNGIAEMRQEAHDLGLVISDETARAAEALNDDLTRLKGSALGLARGIASELIPRMRDVVGDIQDFVQGLAESNINLDRLAAEGMNAVIEAGRIMAIAVVRAAQATLFLRESWLLARNEFGEFVDTLGDVAGRLPVLPFQVLSGVIDGMDLQVTDPETVAADIANMRAISGDLEVLIGHIERVGERASMGVSGALAGIASDVGSAISRATDDLDPDQLLPSPSDVESVIVVIDKYAAAIKDADAAMAEHVRTVQDGMREIFTQYNLGQEEIRRSEEALAADKSFDQLMQMKVDSMADASARIAEEAKGLEGQFSQLGKLGETALGGLTKGITDLSMAAVWEKDGDALKSFGLALGKMLVQLGTMAVVYAGVAALGAVFPALAPLVGPPAAAPALAAAGAGAIAAGALLGATIPRGGGGAGATPPREERGGPTTTTNIYQVSFDSLTPARARNRAMVESLGSSVESGA